jgi:transposase-like protein
MVAPIAGETVDLWRAVDDESEILNVLVKYRRDKAIPEADAQAARPARRRGNGQAAIVASGLCRAEPDAAPRVGLETE